MRGNELLDQIEFIDPAYIEAAGAPQKSRKNVFVKWGAVAACFCMVLAATIFALPGLIQEPEQDLDGAGGLAGSESPKTIADDDADIDAELTDDNSNGVIVDNTIDDVTPATSEVHISLSNLYFNEIGGISDAARWYDPELCDIDVVWDKDEVTDYYGKDLTSLYIPDGLIAASGNGTAKVVLEKMVKLWMIPSCSVFTMTITKMKARS